ncbi:DUF4340 domain-containing protein [Pseudobacteriovorax antillogorgiicola]|uniref:DUF4340 domain-containing protein n=1 Tax=Pseudobacteriovorax antillogorgiicola TaxID=1513793 RepID=A0A1Y6B4N1_9BACT|nr:DUF4340 domain-containing protein [Pseudobacteriovorax antillogorgiicola]TCS59349.1 uncharacterized protein DUF4340 [Pseudobacteriovorax antillogorgiicola]SME89098.1 protein of unknown function [Pseudobacteriovorax antillogorgiicola]
MKSLKTPLILLVIIAALAGVGYWDEWQTKQDKDASDKKNLLFTDLKAEDVSKISIQSQDKGLIVAEKRDAVWHLVKPRSARADQDKLSSLVKSLVDYKYERDLGAQKDDGYGLEEPKVKVIITHGDKTTSLMIGNKSPVGFSSYLKLADNDAVFLGNHYIFTSLDKKFDDFRDKTLGLPKLSRLDRWELNLPEQQFAFARKDQGWVFESPVTNQSLDEEALRKSVSAFSGSIVEEFIDEPSTELMEALKIGQNGTENLGNVAWTDFQGQRSSLLILSNNESLYGKLNDQQGYLKLSDELRSELEKTLWDFQDKRLVSFDSNSVKSVLIDGTSFIKSENGVWNEAGKEEVSVEHPRLLLVDLEYGRAISIIEKEWDLGEPLHRAEITMNDGGVLKISVWQHPENEGEAIIRKEHESSKFYITEDSILENFVASEVEDDEAPLESQG